MEYMRNNSNLVEFNGRQEVKLKPEEGASAAGTGCIIMDAMCKACMLIDRREVNLVDEYGFTPLMYAVQRGHSTCVLFLLTAGANVNAKGPYGRTALMEAAQYNKLECMKLLIQAGADVNSITCYKGTALQQAAKTSCEQCVSLLIKSGANVNVTGTHGMLTPLFYAARYGKPKAVSLMLRAGAKVNIALIGAAMNKDPECLNILLQAKPDLDVTDDRGETAVFHASRLGNNKALDLLIQAGADVNKLNYDACSPLMAVSVSRCTSSTKCIQLLLRANVQINQTNAYGQNALILHMSLGLYHGAMLLFAAGEKLEKAQILKYRIQVPDSMATEIQRQLSLKHSCRMVIRHRLIQLDPSTNLFQRIHLLGLPKSLAEYLLFYTSLTQHYDDSDYRLT